MKPFASTMKIILLFTALILLFTTGGPAWAVSYPYINESGTSANSPANTEELVGNETALNDSSGGWYIITTTTTNFSSRITVSGNVHLILMDECDVTINGGIRVEGANSLTIYSQTGNSGKLTATGNNSARIGGTIAEVEPGATAALSTSTAAISTPQAVAAIMAAVQPVVVE